MWQVLNFGPMPGEYFLAACAWSGVAILFGMLVTLATIRLTRQGRR